MYVDVAIVHPYRATPGAAARYEELDKEARYETWRDLVRVAAGREFCPLVLEHYGLFGGRAAELVSRLAARAAKDRGVSEKRECRRWVELLSARLALDQAEILLDT